MCARFELMYVLVPPCTGAQHSTSANPAATAHCIGRARRARERMNRTASAIVVAAYAAASGLPAIAVAAFVSGYWPPDPPLAGASLVGEALVLLTLTLALGSVLPSIAAGAIAVVGFGLGWMAGVLAGVGGQVGRGGE